MEVQVINQIKNLDKELADVGQFAGMHILFPNSEHVRALQKVIVFKLSNIFVVI